MTLKPTERPLALGLVILAQILSAGYFLGEVIFDGITDGWSFSQDPELLPELLITLTLVVAIFFEIRYLRHILRHQAVLERQVDIAAGALHGVMQEHFASWALTPAERDVALFTLKGLTIPEIAAQRGSAEGTVKSHLSAIYRKAGVSGRGGLLSLVIEDLMASPLVTSGGNGATDPAQSPPAADRPPLATHPRPQSGADQTSDRAD